MKKLFVIFTFIAAILILQNKTASYVKADSIHLNNSIMLGEQSNIFDVSENGGTDYVRNNNNNNNNKNQNNKENTFFRIQDKDNGKNPADKFMIKGTITASSSNSITINNQVILIDSSVTGNVKIVGTLQTGAYAMVSGVIQNSNYYATKIVVDQRNKEELNEQNKSTGLSSAKEEATGSANVEESNNANASISAELDFGNIIRAVQNLLNYLTGLASKI